MKLKNYTPLLDSLVRQYGLVTAAVWGRVWRYEQGDERVCKASHETLADGLGVHPRTIIRHLETLIDAGYILDHTPERRNKPHELNTTTKARLEFVIEGVDEGVTESHTGMTESHTKPEDGVTLSHSHYDSKSHEERIKETVKNKKIKERAAPAAPPKDPTAQQLMFQALADVTLMDPKINAGRIGKGATALVKAGYTPDQVTALFLPGGVWYQRDWRGQRGDPPTPEQVGQTIRALMDPAFQDAPIRANGKLTTFERNMAALNKITAEVFEEVESE